MAAGFLLGWSQVRPSPEQWPLYQEADPPEPGALKRRGCPLDDESQFKASDSVSQWDIYGEKIPRKPEIAKRTKNDSWASVPKHASQGRKLRSETVERFCGRHGRCTETCQIPNLNLHKKITTGSKQYGKFTQHLCPTGHITVCTGHKPHQCQECGRACSCGSYVERDLTHVSYVRKPPLGPPPRIVVRGLTPQSNTTVASTVRKPSLTPQVSVATREVILERSRIQAQNAERLRLFLSTITPHRCQVWDSLQLLLSI